MKYSSRAGSLVLLIWFCSIVAVQASERLFSGAPGATVEGSVFSSDAQSNAILLFEPRNGSLSTADGTPGLASDGRFRYTPDADFEGVDRFFFSVLVDGEAQIRSARIFSGAIEVRSAADRQQALTVAAAANRSPAMLGPPDTNLNSQWLVDVGQGTVTLGTALNAGNSVLETWQPAGAGLDATIYRSNRRVWQRFELLDTLSGNDAIRSVYTDRVLAVNEGAVVTQDNETESLADDWLIAGVSQTLSPSPRDDVFSGTAGSTIRGRVLRNDAANSIDFASFLVSRPRHGQFVGINQIIYDGLAPFGDFEYQPNEGFVGIDEFTYTVLGSSSGVPSTLVRVKLVVRPQASSVWFTTAMDQVLLNRVPISLDSAQAQLVAQPRYGELIGTDQSVGDGLSALGEFEYSPPAGFEGVDSFAYSVTDNGVASDVVTAFVAVGQVRIAPLNDWRLAVHADSDRNRTPFVLEQAMLPERQTFELIPLSSGDGFRLAFNGKSLETWQPSAVGEDVTLYGDNGFPWQRFDIDVNETTGSAEIVSQYTGFSIVTPTAESRQALKALAAPDDPTRAQWLFAGIGQAFGPTAVNDDFFINRDSVLEGDLFSNDQPNGFDQAAFLIAGPRHGQLVGIGALIYDGITPWGFFEYQPDPGFVGEDSFIYQSLSSASGAPSRFATVKIRVQ